MIHIESLQGAALGRNLALYGAAPGEGLRKPSAGQLTLVLKGLGA